MVIRGILDDLDVFIAMSDKDAAGTVKTFRDFGFTDLEISEADFLEEDTIVEIGREPLKIQVMTGISGVTFDECFEDRILVAIDDLSVPVISYEKLIKNKIASGRSKDSSDVEELTSRRSSDFKTKP